MRKIFTLLALLCALVLTAKAEIIYGTCSDTTNVDWSYNTDTKTLSFMLKGTNSQRWFIPDYGPLNQPWHDFIEDIEFLEFPENLSGIGIYAFCGATSIKDVVLPQSITNINQYSFYECHSIHTFVLGPNVTTIAQHAFNGCYSLTNLVVPESVKEVKYRAFYMVPNVAGDSAYIDGAGARSVNGIVEDPMVYDPQDKTRLRACSAVAKGYVRVQKGVKTINDDAFFSCVDITTVELPNSVETVGKYTFDECKAMETLIIGNGLKNTGMYAFSIAGLKTVVCMAVTPPALGGNAFYDTKTKNAILYVPDESVNAYKEADQWEDFGTIKPLSEMPAGIVIGEGIDNISIATPANKIIRDGVVLIERNGRTYTTSGQEIK